MPNQSVRKMFFLIVSCCFITGCGEGETSVVAPDSTQTPAENAGATDETTLVAAADIVNSYCPIMGHEIDKSEVTADLTRTWNDKIVAFCCPPCLEEWDEMTDEEKAESVANPPKKEAH